MSEHMQALLDGKRTPRTRWEQLFAAYHKANPRVYALWDRFCQEAVKAGATRIGANMVLERIRWFAAVEARTELPWKICQNFQVYYARLWVELNPDHRGLFAFHGLRAKPLA